MKLIEEFSSAKNIPFYLQHSHIIEKDKVIKNIRKYRDVSEENKYQMTYLEVIYPTFPIHLRCKKL